MPSSKRLIVLGSRTLIAAVAVGCLAAGAVYWSERSVLYARRNGATHVRHSGPLWFSIDVPGVKSPPTVAASSAGLGASEDVIGVEVGGKSRAYQVAALRDRSRHVVNDLVGGVPVTVAYCDLTDCVRVYTDPRSSAPLDVAVAGLLDGEMVVKLGGMLYIHKSGQPLKPRDVTGAFPYERLTPARMSWSEWVGKHPETDVYVGGGAGREASGKASAESPR